MDKYLVKPTRYVDKDGLVNEHEDIKITDVKMGKDSPKEYVVSWNNGREMRTLAYGKQDPIEQVIDWIHEPLGNGMTDHENRISAIEKAFEEAGEDASQTDIKIAALSERVTVLESDPTMDYLEKTVIDHSDKISALEPRVDVLETKMPDDCLSRHMPDKDDPFWKSSEIDNSIGGNLINDAAYDLVVYDCIGHGQGREFSPLYRGNDILTWAAVLNHWCQWLQRDVCADYYELKEKDNSQQSSINQMRLDISSNATNLNSTNAKVKTNTDEITELKKQVAQLSANVTALMTENAQLRTMLDTKLDKTFAEPKTICWKDKNDNAYQGSELTTNDVETLIDRMVSDIQDLSYYSSVQSSVMNNVELNTLKNRINATATVVNNNHNSTIPMFRDGNGNVI